MNCLNMQIQEVGRKKGKDERLERIVEERRGLRRNERQ